jgi:hypothetical protein
VAGGGVFIPLYYGLFLISTVPIGKQSVSQRRINVKDAWIYLPLLFTFNYGPVMAMLYHPTFEGRHYWTWFWQLYAVRMTIAYYIISPIVALLPFSTPRVGYRTTVALVLAPLIAISAAMWIYTVLNCPHPLAHVFWPEELVVDTWLGRLRRILQFDYLFLNGVGLLWATVLLRDVGMRGFGETVKIVLVAGMATAALGPAAALGLMWVWREVVVDSQGGEQVFGAERKEKEG